MRISSKGRYGLGALASMAKMEGDTKTVTVLALSQRLQISKIYLEQVFTLLKRGGLVVSVKGANGGYHLSRPAKDITVYDILFAVEASIFEKTEATIKKGDEDLENAINMAVYDKLDDAVTQFLTSISLEDVIANASDGYMYYL